MLDKKRGYANFRPFYVVDQNAEILAGMVAFLASSGGVEVATVAASGTVPIGCFWKDRANGYVRSTVESRVLNATGFLTLTKGNVLSTLMIKVTSATGMTIYTQGIDYTVTTTNGIVTRIPGGAIPAGATLIIWYKYVVSSTQVYWDNVSTKWSSGYNYDRQPDDTLGSSKITVAESDAKLYTDQYDVTQTYTLNHWLRADANSLWTTAVTVNSICGRVIKVPTAADPYLGVQQVMVAS